MDEITIKRVENGYIVEYYDIEKENIVELVIEDKNDQLEATEELLWEILNYFGKAGSRHDKERLTIKRKPGDKYEGK